MKAAFVASTSLKPNGKEALLSMANQPKKSHLRACPPNYNSGKPLKIRGSQNHSLLTSESESTQSLSWMITCTDASLLTSESESTQSCHHADLAIPIVC